MLFRIASISKVLTGLTILQMIQKGKVHYEDKVLSILSGLPPLDSENTTKALKDLTVRDLLLMSGGWLNVQKSNIDPIFGPLPLIAKTKFHLRSPVNCIIVARLMQNIPIDFKPGTQFAYANTNYCYLGVCRT